MRCAVVIPVMTQHYPMLQRNLLYTGVTRGKKLVVLAGTACSLGREVAAISPGAMGDLPAAWGEAFHGRNAGTRSPSPTVSLAVAPTVDLKASVSVPTWRITIRVRGSMPSATKARAPSSNGCDDRVTIKRPAFHRAWKQSACAQRDRGGLLPGRPLADSHVPHCAVSRVVDAPEGRLLSRRTIRLRIPTKADSYSD
jgi:hypothetical protein